MNQAKIMIVEDEALIGAELSEILIDLGYKVTGVLNSADKALNNFKNETPDLVLMDIKIKGEMDGIQVAECIKQMNGPPVIFITAELNDELINRAKITEPFGYLIKPVSKRELQSSIAISLYKASMEKEKNELIEKLKFTQQELEKTRNFIPICSKCKKIRDKDGEWSQVETYISKNFPASFSHGICPACTEELYPDMYKRLNKK